MDKQQIKKILDNAPDGATHYHKNSVNPYWKLTFINGYQRFVRNKENLLNDEPDKIYGLYRLDELRTQLALIEENEKLKDALNAAIRACYDLDAHSARHENDDYLKACEVLDEVDGAI